KWSLLTHSTQPTNLFLLPFPSPKRSSGRTESCRPQPQHLREAIALATPSAGAGVKRRVPTMLHVEVFVCTGVLGSDWAFILVQRLMMSEGRMRGGILVAGRERRERREES